MFKRKTFDLFDVLAAVFSDKALINPLYTTFPAPSGRLLVEPSGAFCSYTTK